jgi:hypothetical protein
MSASEDVHPDTEGMGILSIGAHYMSGLVEGDADNICQFLWQPSLRCNQDFVAAADRRQNTIRHWIETSS